MTKNKKLKNRKRYLGNPFTIAFLPVLAATGLTLGATCLSIKTSGGDEEVKPHDIQIQPVPGSSWNLTCTKSRAKKGDEVTFKATGPSDKNEDAPVGVNINGSIYYFDDPVEHTVTITINFIQKMVVTLAFEQGQQYHNVLFNDNNGHIWSVTVKHNYYLSKPLDPTKEGYSFEGWYKDPSFSTTSKWNFETDKVFEDGITLYAKWGEEEEGKAHDITVPSEPVNGWKLTSSVSSARKGDTVVFTMVRDGEPVEEKPRALNINGHILENLEEKEVDQRYEITVQIIWTAKMDASIEFVHSPFVTHSVTFDTQGGSTIPAQKIVYGKNATKPDNPTKTGYTFVDKWYTDLATKTEFEFDNTPITNDIILYADWTAKDIDVTFNPDNGSEIIHKSTKFGQTPELPPNPEKVGPTGYKLVFDHWETKETHQPVQPVSSEEESENAYIAIYNKVPIEQTITFTIPNGPYVEPIKVGYGETIPSAPSVTWEHHNITGWTYTNDQGETVPWIFKDKATTEQPATVVTKPVELTATYTTDQYTITFKNPKVGEKEGKVFQNTQWDYGSLPVYSGETPTIDVPGKIAAFKGWDKQISIVTGNETYIAQYDYSPAKYIVSFDLNGGSGNFPDRTCLYGDKLGDIGTPTPPTDKSNYTFNGWFKEEDLITKFDPVNDEITGNLRLHAEWKPPLTDISKFTVAVSEPTLGVWVAKIEKYNGTDETIISLPETYKDSTHGDIPIVSILPSAFGGHHEILEVYLPENVNELYQSSFLNCSSLHKINTRSIRVFGQYCLQGTNIEKFIFSPNAVSFEQEAFKECKSLTTIDFVESSTANQIYMSNASGCFRGCPLLEKARFPKRINTMGSTMYMFQDCLNEKFTTLEFEGTKAEWDAIYKGYHWLGYPDYVSLRYLKCSDGKTYPIYPSI